MKLFGCVVLVLLAGCTGPVVVDTPPDEAEPEEYELEERHTIAPLETSGASLNCGTGTVVDTECEWGPNVKPIAEGFDPSDDVTWMCVGKLTDGAKSGWVVARVWCTP
jgi:hypothetical protein